MAPIFIIDFDSTFVSVESLDELAKIALKDKEEKEEVIHKIEEITKLGMDGTLDFTTSLKKRLSLFQANEQHVKELIVFLKKNISSSILRNSNFFKENKKNIYIISGGFIEYIAPVVEDFDISYDHILANQFTFNAKKDIIGFENKNFLAQPKGKAKAVASLGLMGEVYVIGDGYTDYEIKKEGCAEKFYLFTENIERKALIPYADRVITSFDELI